jgi:hypothetical protein
MRCFTELTFHVAIRTRPKVRAAPTLLSAADGARPEGDRARCEARARSRPRQARTPAPRPFVLRRAGQFPPADPSYPGAHSVVAAASARVLDRLLGTDRRSFTVTSEVLPGVTRSFSSFEAAAQEAGLSRIVAGVHTRLDHTSGRELGRDVASFDLPRLLR